MADVSLSDLGSASSPLGGLSASDYGGYGSGGNQTDPSSGIGSWGGAAALGVGAAGFGSILARGEPALPAQYGQLQGQVPYLQQTGQDLTTQGQALKTQGANTVAMGAAGQLTAPQQAQLSQYSSGLENKSRQMFMNMGRNPDADTAAITQSGNDMAQVNAMAQQQIQSTLALGFGQMTQGSTDISQGLQFQSQADQILYQAAQAQVAQDKAYGDSLTSAFGSIATMFSKAAPLLAAA